jgi:hypothetical protein
VDTQELKDKKDVSLAIDNPIFAVLQGNVRDKFKDINPEIFKGSYEKVVAEMENAHVMDIPDLFFGEKAN